MKNYFKIYNQIFKYSLSTNALLVYAAISRFANRFNFTAVKNSTLAQVCDISPRSVSRAIDELAARNLIAVKERYNLDGQRASNGYIINQLVGGFTRLPNEIFSAKLSKGAFAVYLFIRKCAGNGLKAFPSLQHIASNLSITIKTVLDKIAELVAGKLISKRHCIKRDNSYSNNQYTIAIAKEISAKKEAAAPLSSTPTEKAQPLAQENYNFLDTTLNYIFSKINTVCKKFTNICAKARSFLRGVL